MSAELGKDVTETATVADPEGETPQEDDAPTSSSDEAKPSPSESDSKKQDEDEDDRDPGDVVGVVQRFKVLQKLTFGTVTLSELTNIDCDGAPIVEAFPAIGLIGVLSVKQLQQTLKLPLIAVLTSECDDFQVSCVVTGEQPSYPARIYGNKELVVFMCENDLPVESVSSVVACVYDFAYRHKCPMLFSVEGFPHEEEYELPTGEKVQLSRKGEDEEDGPQQDSMADLMVIDDTHLATLTLRKERKTDGEGNAGDDARPKSNPRLLSLSGRRPSSKMQSAKPKRKASKGKDKKDEDDEENIDEIAEKMFGNKIHYVSTSVEMAKRLRLMGHIPVVDGVIPGVTGGLLAKAPLTSQKLTVLLAPTSTVIPSYDSAVNVLELLHELMPKKNISKAATDLKKEGVSMEKAVSAILKGLQGQLHQEQNVNKMMYY